METLRIQADSLRKRICALEFSLKTTNFPALGLEAGERKATINALREELLDVNLDLAGKIFEHFSSISNMNKNNPDSTYAIETSKRELKHFDKEFGRLLDEEETGFRTKLALSSVRYEDDYWNKLGGSDMDIVDVSSLFTGYVSNRSKLDKLWEQVLSAKDYLGISRRTFNTVYFSRYVEALKLRTEIFKVRQAREVIPEGSRKKCRFSCFGRCRQCQLSKVYREGVALEKVCINKLVDIYTVFTNLVNRKVEAQSSVPVKKSKIVPMQGKYLRLKGYITLITDLSEDFAVWWRNTDQRKTKNRLAKQYLFDCRMGTAEDHDATTSYYCYLENDEPIVSEDVPLERGLPRRIKGITKKESSLRQNKLVYNAESVSKVASWRALPRKQRQLALQVMSKTERADTMYIYTTLKSKVMQLVPRIRDEYLAKKYRCLPTATEPMKKKRVSTQYREKVEQVFISNREKQLLRYVTCCSSCRRLSIYSTKTHMVEKCAYERCKNYHKGGSLTKGVRLPPGTLMPYHYFKQISDTAFIQAADIELEDHHTITLNEKGYYVKSDVGSTAAHCLRAPHKRFVDVCAPGFSKVTDKLFLGKPDGLPLTKSGVKIADWHYSKGELEIIVCDSFKFKGNLLSGTPIFNSEGLKCSIVTSSFDDYYCLPRLSGKVYSVKCLESRIYQELVNFTKINQVIVAVVKHSTRNVQNATNVAKSLAQARVTSAVAGAHVETIRREIEAVRDLQDVAERNIADVVKRTTGVNQVVRRKKRSRPTVSTTLAIVACISVFLFGGVSSASTTKSIGDPVGTRNQLDSLVLILNGFATEMESNCGMFNEWYYQTLYRLKHKLFTDEKYSYHIKLVLIGYHHSDAKVLVNAMTKINAIKYISNSYTWLSEQLLKCGQSDKQAARGTTSIKMDTQEILRVLQTDNSPEVKEIIEHINVLQNSIAHDHDRIKRSIDDHQSSLDEDQDWRMEFGKQKKEVLECLLPLVGNYSRYLPKDIENQLKNNFTTTLQNCDYEGRICKELRHHYRELISCTKSGIFMKEYQSFAHMCVEYQKCKTALNEVIVLLRTTFDSNIAKPSVTYLTCASIKAEFERKFKGIKLSGHFSGVQISPISIQQCQDNNNWKADGWLGGTSGSCVNGVEDSSWRVRGCVDLPLRGCINAPSSKCSIGWGNITRKDQVIYSNSHKNLTTSKCCSLHCHQIEYVYEIMTHQPLCTSCIIPFTPIFWNEQCLLQYPKRAIHSISVMVSKTVFEVDGVGSVECNNAWHFKVCCGNRGPASYNVVGTFKDKYCVCSQQKANWLQILQKRIVTLSEQFFSPIHVLIFFITFLLFVSHRGVGIFIFVLVISWMFVSSQAACSVENLVPVDATTSIHGASATLSQVKVKPGQCISVGEATIELVSIEVTTVYNFLRAMPYFIKPVCQLLDWGCPGGVSNKVYEQVSDCYENCVPGLRKQWVDSEYDWIGDKCFLNGRVATRLDLCFSYGAPNSFVELYTRVSGTPILKLHVKFHGIGYESVGQVETSTLGTDSPITITDVVTQPLFWPEMISYRLGRYSCAYHYVESADTCNSGDIFKPTDIDVDCLDLKKRWDTAHGGYQLTFGKKDFETQLNNQFIDCGLDFEIDNNVTTLGYKQHINWVEFKITGNNFKFASAVPFCESLSKWKITSEPGLTYYHRRTKITYTNSGTNCKILVSLDGCLSTNGNLIVLSNQDKAHIIEYWCGHNATGVAHITVRDGRVETKELRVLNNFLPHKNTIRNGFERVVRAATITDLSTWFNNLVNEIDFVGVFAKIDWLWNWIWSFSWGQLIIGALLLTTAYINFTRGRIVTTVLCVFAVWLVCFTKLAFAYQTTHAHGSIGVVQIFMSACEHLVRLLLFTDLDFGVVFSFCAKFMVSTSIWFCYIVGSFSVIDIEYLCSKYIRWAITLLSYLYGDIYSMIFVLLALNFCEVYDKLLVLSGCENKYLQYNCCLTSWLTKNIVSTSNSVFSEVSDPLCYVDTPCDTSKQVLAVASTLIKCNDKKVDPHSIKLPTQVLSYDTSVVKVEGIILIHYFSQGSPCVAIMSHCLEGNTDVEDSMYFTGDMQKLKTIFITPQWELAKGDSGIPIQTQGGIKWFSGTKDDVPEYTDKLVQYTLEWEYTSVDCSLLHHGSVLQVPNIGHVPEGDRYLTTNCLYVGLANATQVIVPCKNIVVSNAVIQHTLCYTLPSGNIVNVSPGAGAHIVQDMQITGDVEIVEAVLSNKQLLDPFGYKYTKLPKGLVSDICWPSHVLLSAGVEVCNDVRMQSRTALVNIASRKNFKIYTWVETSFKRISATADKYIWWPSNTPSQVQPEALRLQKSRVFECNENLTSGSLIYTTNNCVWGSYFPISCVTQSFTFEDKRYYVVASPSDDYVLITTFNGVLPVDVPTWACSAVNESQTATSYQVRSYNRTHVLEFYNASGHCVKHLKQDFGVFPVMQLHSPTKLRAMVNTSSLKNHAEGCEFLDLPDRISDLDEQTMEIMVKFSERLLLLQAANGLMFERCFKKIRESVAIYGAASVETEMNRLNDIPIVPAASSVAINSQVTGECYYMVTDLVTPKPPSQATITVTVLCDKNKFSVSNIGVENWDIVCKHEEVQAHLESKISRLVLTGFRYITVTICGTHIEQVQGLGALLIRPLAVALTTCIFFKTDNKGAIKSHFLNQPPLSMRHLTSLLRSEWTSGEFDTRRLITNDTHRVSTSNWRDIVGTASWETRDVTTSRGEKVFDLEHLGIWRTGDILIGLMRNCVTRGSFFMVGKSLVTNWHVTKGQPVHVSNRGLTYTFEKPIYCDKLLDVCMYGEKLEFEKVSVGEIVTVLNPCASFGFHYMVNDASATLQGRGSNTFLKMLPIKVDLDGLAKVVNTPLFRGISGSPIVNIEGKVVGIFGLGVPQRISTVDGIINTTVSFAGTGEMRLDNTSFFEMCASNFVNSEEGPEAYHYCNAPTGTGKTTMLPPFIVKHHVSRTGMGCKVLILQPNVASVLNCSKYMASLLDTLEVPDCKVGYEVGLRNTVSNCWEGGERDTMNEIVIKTYGKNFESWRKMSNFNYVLLDEVHVNKDASLVATLIRIQTNPNQIPGTKFLYLSATHLSVEGGIDIANGETLSSHPRKIEPIGWTVLTATEKASTELTDTLVITKKIIKCMPDHAIKIDTRYLRDGLALFFCATKRDCEAGATFASKLGVKSWAYHGDSSQVVFNEILSHVGVGWIFATDIIQQSVTLPNLTCVVDFMTECKPKVFISKEPLTYRCTIESRRIDSVTQIQRKGRVGRTIEGVYISGSMAEATRTIEHFVMPEVALKLLDVGIDLSIAKAVNQEVQNAIRNLDWMSPSKIHKYTPRSILQMCKVGMAIDYRAKLELTAKRNFDRVKWYMRPIYDVSEKDFYSGDIGARMIGEDMDSFWQRYDCICVPVGDKEIQQLASSGIYFSTFKEPFGLNEDENSLVHDVSSHERCDIVANDQLEELELRELNIRVVAFGITGIACVYALFEKLMDTKTSRMITHVSAIPKQRVASASRYLAVNCSAPSKEVISTWKILNDVKSWIYDHTYQLYARFGPQLTKSSVQEQSDFQSFLVGWFNWLESMFSEYVASDLSFKGFLGTLAGGATLGSVYRDLENSVGRPLAMVVAMSLSGMVAYLMSTKFVFVFCASTFVSQVTRAIISSYSDRFNSTNHSGTAWATIISMAAGVCAGHGVKKMAVQSTLAAAGANVNNMIVASRSNVGTVGVPMLLVKHVYTMLKAKNATVASIAGTSIASLLFDCNWITLAYAAVFGAAVYAIEIVAIKALDHFVTRDYGTPDNGAYLRKKKEALEAIAATILDMAAGIVYPQSILSWVIGATAAYSRGADMRTAMQGAWETYAGVSPLIALVAEILSTLNGTCFEQSNGGITAFFDLVMGKILNCGRYVGKMSDVFKTAWQHVKRLFNAGCELVSDKIAGTVGKSISKAVENTYIGKLFARGQVRAIEPLIIYNRDPDVEKYFVSIWQERGLGSIERYWHMLDPGSSTVNGDNDNNFLLEELRSSNCQVNSGLRINSVAPYSFFKVRVDSIGKLVSNIVGSCTYSSGDLKASLSGCGLSADIRFGLTYDDTKLIGVIKLSVFLADIYWVIEAAPGDTGTKLTIVGYGPTGELELIAVEGLGQACGFDQNSLEKLGAEDLSNWDKCNVHTEKKDVGMVRSVIRVCRNVAVKTALLLSKVEQFIDPDFVYGPTYSQTFFEGCPEPDYCRYWAGPLTAHIFNQKGFAQLSYYNPTWNFPYGIKDAWLMSKKPKGYCPKKGNKLVYGLRCKNVKWPTVILVTDRFCVTKFLCCLSSLNWNCNISIEYQNTMGDWISEKSVYGNETACPKCSISFVVHKNEWYYKKNFECCPIDVDEIDFSEMKRQMLLLYAGKSTITLPDLNFLSAYYGKKAGSVQGEIAKVSFESSMLNTVLLSDHLEEKIFEMKESMIDRILGFFGLYDKTEDFTSDVDVLNRLNYLFTIAQLDTVEEQFYDCPPISIDAQFAIGFDKVVTGKQQNWSPYRYQPRSVAVVSADDVMHLHRVLNSYNCSPNRWETISRKCRVSLPKNACKSATSIIQTQSRGFYKMQQLYEAWPEFFNNSKVFLDPACGYGGFEQFLATCLGRSSPRVAFVSTLIEGQHRVPDIDKLGYGNFKVFSLIDPRHGTGNLRSSASVQFIRNAVLGKAQPDLIIFDIGEFFDTSEQQYSWWARESPNSLISGMVSLIGTLQKGGKMLLKWTGFFKGGDVLLHKLIHKFKELRVIKLGTSSLFSTEFYIYCSGYNNACHSSNVITAFYDDIGELVYSHLTKAKIIWFNPKSYKEEYRKDWIVPVTGDYVYHFGTDYKNRPPSITYEFKYGGQNSIIEWNPNWDDRISRMKIVLNQLYDPTGKRKLKFVEAQTGAFSKLYEYGYVQKKVPLDLEKDCYNGLLSDVVWHGFRLDKLNSAIGLTQTLEKQKEQSFKKRLDVSSPIMSPQVASEIREIMQALLTNYATEKIGSFRLVPKDRVEVMLNKQGATSILSKTSNLKSFMEAYPNWYDICLEYCVSRWQKGENSHCFFNVMHKNEPKKKKNVVDGKIVLEKGAASQYEGEELKEELEDHCLLGHRYIQYADEISRISHYIVLGDLIEAANCQKLYKGTINGTPPYVTGNVLRATWDLNSEPNHRFFFNGSSRHGIDTDYRKKLGGKERACGIIIDFSSFDTTVTVAERMAEFDWISQFYPHAYRTMLSTMFSEMCHALCVDHYGKIWLRSGQRGSGEIVTSIGNTLICVANIIRCIKRATGSTISEVTKTVGHMRYAVGNKTKVIELMPYMLYGDGDDIVIITTEDIARPFVKVHEEVLTGAGKSVRSGTKSGCSVVYNFYELEFCSHHYEPVLLGEGANFVHTLTDLKKKAESSGYLIKFMPTRPSSEILGKLRATLKRETMIWNYDKMPDRAVDITRGKLVSYLILYPHMRYVRLSVLAALSVIGDGKVSLDEFNKRFGEALIPEFSTVAGALCSVHGVATLDDVSLRNYRADAEDAQVLKNNALLTNRKIKNDVSRVSYRLFEFLKFKKAKNTQMLKLDAKIFKRWTEHATLT